tara:strand:+ start:264 stop:2126 length:1863 start_codon:yes stop_codon:yes gene_type:complete
MCGISGIINFQIKPNITLIKNMNDKISYRGPDFKSVWSNSFSGIGFVRLAIIDLSENANQPFVNRNKKVTIVYNGEIYNFKELKKKYFKNKFFKSTGDGEVLIYLYEKFGIRFLNKIKGMYSIFISDEEKKLIYLIRDRFGIKPLYYYYDDKLKELTFCSEIPGIFENKKISKEQNYSETFRYLNQGLVSATDETWFKNVYQVKPSNYVKFDLKGFQQIQYYKLEDNVGKADVRKSFFYYKEKFFDKLKESFTHHTIFDVPAGIHQSGGLDSTALVAMTKILNKKFDTYTFDFENKNFSEVNNAKKLSDSAGLENYTSLIKDKDLQSYLQKVIEIQYEPFSSLRVVSQHHLFEKFRNKSKVILDGTGGDEIFGGYHYHAVAWHLDMLRNQNSNEKINKRFNKITKNHETLDKDKFKEGALKRLNGSGIATEDGSEYYNKKLLSNDFLTNNYCDTVIKKPFKSYLSNAQYTDLFYFKLPRCLRYIDRASMRFGVEARVPFLDHEFVELCFSLPNEFKMGFGQQRLMMKYLIRNELDRSLILQNKRTIADPQTYWLKNTLKEMVLDLLNSKEAKNSEIFNQKEILKFYDQFLKSNKHVNSFFLFQIINTLLWQKNILKGLTQ